MNILGRVSNLHGSVSMALASIDFWVKVAQIAQGLLTPAIAVGIGIITYRIQRQQARTQRQQAETHHLQYRLALMERRMKVFDSTLNFIALVLQEARIETLEPLFRLLRETREHNLFFGAEIGSYIDVLYKKGLRLNTIFATMLPGNIMRPEDIPQNTEIVEWFSGQSDVARAMFLKYIDFREP